MWMTDPKLLCRNHLLGEHKEVHMVAGCLRRKKTLGRYLTDKLVDPTLVSARHEVLVVELTRRGYNHKSPLGDAPYEGDSTHIDPEVNLRELARRCPACATRQVQVGAAPA